MNNQESEKAKEIIKNYKNSSNKDLIFVMDYVQKDFDFTKEMVIKGTEHLDKLEITYNTILKEYKKRTNT
jgi:BMFP domain-containing protein YqiC